MLTVGARGVAGGAYASTSGDQRALSGCGRPIAYAYMREAACTWRGLLLEGVQRGK